MQDIYFLPIVAIELLMILIIIIFFNSLKNKEIEKLRKEKCLWISNKAKLSMISMRVRSYKEGENIFTVMRDIQEILRKEDEENDQK